MVGYDGTQYTINPARYAVWPREDDDMTDTSDEAVTRFTATLHADTIDPSDVVLWFGPDDFAANVGAPVQPLTTIFDVNAQVAHEMANRWNEYPALSAKLAEAEARAESARADALHVLGRAFDAITSGPFDASDERIQHIADYIDQLQRGIDQPQPAPTPDRDRALVKAGMEWAACNLDCGCPNGFCEPAVCEYPANCPKRDVDEIRAAASNPDTLDEIAKGAGELLRKAPGMINRGFAAGIEEGEGGSARRQGKILDEVRAYEKAVVAALAALQEGDG